MTDQVIPLKDRLNIEILQKIGSFSLPCGPCQIAPDKTRAPRKTSSLPGYLRVQGKARMINCKITDMSATGACLKVVSADRNVTEDITSYPPNVTLYIIFDKISVECEIIWRKEDELMMGVSFRSPPRPTS